MPTRSLKKIFEAEYGNVANLLDDNERKEIAARAVQGYDGDKQSRVGWEEQNREGMKLAMQYSDVKNDPFENASSVMYPLISVATIQFAARAYPNLIPGWDIVKGMVIGQDEGNRKADAAKRVALHMNYQLNEEMKDWVPETDRLLTVLPIVGCGFKETYWSRNLKQIVSQYVPPTDLVMHYKAKSMTTVPRITKKYELYPHEVTERIRAGVFRNFEMSYATTSKDEGEETTAEYDPTDEYRPHLFLQQHAWLDLDEDGYPEPYILNIHYDTKELVRIVPRFKEESITFSDTKGKIQRIKAKQHYTKFTFLPSPDGSIYDWGFGALLGPLNHTANTLINQLVDAGTMNNSQAGFVGNSVSFGRGDSGGPMTFARGEWRQVKVSGDDLKKNILPLSQFMKEPSGVLFSLLEFIISAGEKLSSVTELFTGEQSVHNEPATTSLARIEQGGKVFASIHKRLYESFGDEYDLIYDLNAENLNPSYYFRIQDEPDAQQQAMQSDYDRSACDIILTASPEDISNSQKVMKGQMLMELRGQGFNDAVISRRYLEALQIPNIDELLDAPPPPPDPKFELERDKLEFEMAKYDQEVGERQDERDMKNLETFTRAIKNLADAEAAEEGPQLEQYKLAAQESMAKMKNDQQERQAARQERQQVRAATQSKQSASAGGNGDQ